MEISRENLDLKLSSYDYTLPLELVAKRPMSQRDQSRLMVYRASDDSVSHVLFSELPNYLPKDSLLLLNQTKVFSCRLLGKKPSGGKAEIFILSYDSREDGAYPCLIKSSGKKKEGDRFLVGDNISLHIKEVTLDGHFWVTLSSPLAEVLETWGKIPIPPYIRKGESDERDKRDYQTVFAKDMGSVAAPTAGLHFTDEVFNELEKKRIEKAFVTLHVGRGTFAPVKTEDIKDHKMHTERYFFSPDNRAKIMKAQEEGRKVFCVGTTSLRALESSVDEKGMFKGEADQIYETDIFLHPGVDVKSVSGLVTNFHLPKSTLLMLISSMIGREKTLALYEEAVRLDYRFFSYGDAMLILK